ncbi:MAG: ribosome biogenesis GTP-binding protein YihA/YsxC [Proteobacteria bacterium]|nr:ribosome biogenesis GTP-binding protein YihA/YsxC [Pseudomonadota bacterium]
MRILSAQYIKSIVKFEETKQLEYPEICFIGRSNVGKSSMINKLVMQKIARTSSTPGATKMVNIYKIHCEVDKERKLLIFSDFPGFGYSKVSKKTYQGWQGMIEGYIRENQYIKRLIWVYDVRREMDEIDSNVIKWIGRTGLDFTLAITKIDKVSKNDVSVKKKLFEQNFGNDRVFVFSSKDGYGRDELLNHISNILGNI